MGSKYLNEEQKKKYEKEFSDFLIQTIKLYGGSPKIDQLSASVPRARFEIRDAFGTKKSDLIKFLRAHPKIFHMDSKGTITILTSGDDSDDLELDTKEHTESKKTLLTEIENGIGFVVKLYPEFGVIRGIEPIETNVHFQAEAFSGNKESLLTDSCLGIGDEVYFNAYCGHEMFDFKFRASKVWQKLDKNESSGKSYEKNAHPDDLKGKGVIQKIFPNLGFISIFGRENETVFFHKNSVRNCDNMELTKYLKVGDPVEFIANRSDKKDYKAQWQAKLVKKKSKDDSVPSLSQTESTLDAVKNKIENIPGKICPYSHGVTIKFGKDYAELADGDSSNYFLYGAEVCDISWEFSEGDDVWFDAIRTKSGWKATLVWVGEKPSCVNNSKILSDEEVNDFSDDRSCASSSNISAICSPSLKSETVKSKDCASMTECAMQDENKLFNHSASKKVTQSGVDYKKQNSKLSKNTQNISSKKSRNKKGSNEHEKANSSIKKNKSNQHRASVEQKVMHKSEQKSSSINKHVSTNSKSHRESDEISICDEYYKAHLPCKDDISDINQGYFQDEFQRGSITRYDFSDSDENDMDSTCNKIKCYKSTDKKNPSIKKFEDIKGEIISLYCKAAIVKSSYLQKDVDFLLNTFYLNGKSVEEQEVIDLKEIFKVGDNVQFNCFEIIDDSGEIHQKVTVAWKGPKPQVYEMTPEEFISEYNLSVTMTGELGSECVPQHRTASQNSLALEMLNSDETLSSFSSDSSVDEMSDDEESRQSRTSETQIMENLEEKKIFDIQNKLLSEVIVRSLKNKGLISVDLQIDFSSDLPEIIRLVQKHCSFSECNQLTENESFEKNLKNSSEPICYTCAENATFSVKNKTKKHVAVQTVITGRIISQSIYTQN